MSNNARFSSRHFHEITMYGSTLVNLFHDLIERNPTRKIPTSCSYLEAVFLTQGNFTVCLLREIQNTYYTSIGVTKRNPEVDEHNYSRACRIAFSRALKNLYPSTE